jgi:hypothetical protein
MKPIYWVIRNDRGLYKTKENWNVFGTRFAFRFPTQLGAEVHLDQVRDKGSFEIMILEKGIELDVVQRIMKD